MLNAPLVLSFVLLLSFPLLFLFAPRVLPHKHSDKISFPDEIDDLALFRRATLNSIHKRGGRGGVRAVSRLGTTNPRRKIAFLFLTNTDLHFAPLWERFFAGHEDSFNIYVHADPSSKVASPGGVFNGRFIAGKRTQRASPSLISAARRLLATAILDDSSNSYFALVSQQCIPLHSFNFVYNSLFLSTQFPAHRSFIEILSGEPQLWDRYIARGENVMLPEVPFDRFRVGSQFFVLTRKHAQLVIKDRRLWRKFKLPCLNKDSCYPEEHYFPTLLSMEDPDGCTHYTLTRVNWTGSVGGHPHTYNPLEISPELIYKLREPLNRVHWTGSVDGHPDAYDPPQISQELRESNNMYSHWFARKFSPDCLKPLMDIADKVIFRE
ncbi:glycosyltransferase BC10 [Nicotiana tomentosiformis]|uniref:glycosyltransferase BC10 n=1 Tax=Nicotiana tomentosiformis TaxID=4098 RepID=UPI00051C00C9|nr:glycosyltransferase BC10 [Nicotiana tomentosiformis]XP_018628800.1 glycosyltransferase BC10 [Nicotiana tomentosiformis]